LKRGRFISSSKRYKKERKRTVDKSIPRKRRNQRGGSAETSQKKGVQSGMFLPYERREGYY